MKTEQQIRSRLAEIEADERLHYPPATTDVNAPLALVQVELETGVQLLHWVLAD